MLDFSKIIREDLPDKAIFKEMGLGSIDSNKVFKQIVNSFGLNKLLELA